MTIPNSQLLDLKEKAEGIINLWGPQWSPELEDLRRENEELKSQLRTALKDTERLNKAQGYSYELTKHVPGRGDPDYVGYAWTFSGQRKDIRTAIDNLPSPPATNSHE